MFGRTSNHREYTTTRRHNRVGHRWGGRRDPDRVAGGYKAALRNPNTTRDGRERAKAELRAMGRGREAHLTLGQRIKRMLHIRATPRRERERQKERRRFGFGRRSSPRAARY